jgi:hypothetical protein
VENEKRSLMGSYETKREREKEREKKKCETKKE